jgi:hypothetical protein
MAVSNDVRFEPRSKYVSMQMPVERIVLDEKAHTIKYAFVVEKIKRSLLLWRVLPTTICKAIFALHINV